MGPSSVCYSHCYGYTTRAYAYVMLVETQTRVPRSAAPVSPSSPFPPTAPSDDSPSSPSPHHHPSQGECVDHPLATPQVHSLWTPAANARLALHVRPSPRHRRHTSLHLILPTVRPTCSKTTDEAYLSNVQNVVTASLL